MQSVISAPTNCAELAPLHININKNMNFFIVSFCCPRLFHHHTRQGGWRLDTTIQHSVLIPPKKENSALFTTLQPIYILVRVYFSPQIVRFPIFRRCITRYLHPIEKTLFDNDILSKFQNSMQGKNSFVMLPQ